MLILRLQSHVCYIRFMHMTHATIEVDTIIMVLCLSALNIYLTNIMKAKDICYSFTQKLMTRFELNLVH